MATKTIDIMHAVTELMRIHGDGASHSVGHVEYEIIEHNEMLIAIIPGTNGLRDVFDNMKFRKKHLKINDTTYKVHEGFLEQADSIFEKVQGCDVFIGHSLGGAVAQICALKTGKPVITVGSPRVGNYRFSLAINELHTRVEGKGDIITHLPPWWLLYFHGGELIKVGESDRPWWKFWSLKEHLIQNYYDAIRKYHWR